MVKIIWVLLTLLDLAPKVRLVDAIQSFASQENLLFEKITGGA